MLITQKHAITGNNRTKLLCLAITYNRFYQERIQLGSFLLMETISEALSKYKIQSKVAIICLGTQETSTLRERKIRRRDHQRRKRIRWVSQGVLRIVKNRNSMDSLIVTMMNH
jgi:hypothetical protein